MFVSLNWFLFAICWMVLCVCVFLFWFWACCFIVFNLFFGVLCYNNLSSRLLNCLIVLFGGLWGFWTDVFWWKLFLSYLVILSPLLLVNLFGFFIIAHSCFCAGHSCLVFGNDCNLLDINLWLLCFSSSPPPSLSGLCGWVVVLGVIIHNGFILCWNVSWYSYFNVESQDLSIFLLSNFCSGKQPYVCIVSGVLGGLIFASLPTGWIIGLLCDHPDIISFTIVCLFNLF